MSSTGPKTEYAQDPNGGGINSGHAAIWTFEDITNSNQVYNGPLAVGRRDPVSCQAIVPCDTCKSKFLELDTCMVYYCQPGITIGQAYAYRCTRCQIKTCPQDNKCSWPVGYHIHCFTCNKIAPLNDFDDRFQHMCFICRTSDITLACVLHIDDKIIRTKITIDCLFAETQCDPDTVSIITDYTSFLPCQDVVSDRSEWST